jgi:hypothetical protein
MAQTNQFLGIVPERIEDRSTRLFADYRLELKERGVRLLLQRSVQCANRYHKSWSFLCRFSIFTAIRGMGEDTIRELGKTFQLRRRPSLSSTSDHCLIVSPIRPPGGCKSYLFFESFNIHGEAREQQLSPPALLQWGCRVTDGALLLLQTG